jgi:hypothetical protein
MICCVISTEVTATVVSVGPYVMDPGFTQELLPEAEVFMFCGEALPAAVAQELLNRRCPDVQFGFLQLFK